MSFVGTPCRSLASGAFELDAHAACLGTKTHGTWWSSEATSDHIMGFTRVNRPWEPRGIRVGDHDSSFITVTSWGLMILDTVTTEEYPTLNNDGVDEGYQ